MRGASSRAKRTAFLPDAATEFFRRRGREAVAFLLLGGAALLLLALLTYSPDDPSFNRATEGEVRNLAGVPGAYAADLLLQTIGLAGALPAVLLVVWGGRLLLRQAISRAWFRFAGFLASLLLAALALATLAVPTSWPLESGLGGFAGSLLLDALARVLQAAGIGLAAGWVGAASGALALGLLAASLGVRAGEWWRLFARIARPTAAAISLSLRLPGLAARRLAPAVGGLAGRLGAGITRRHKPRRAAAVREEWGEPHGFGEGSPSEEGAADAAFRRAAVEEPGLVVPKARAPKPGRRAEAARQATLDLVPEEGYKLPRLDLLDSAREAAGSALDEEGLAQNARLLEAVLGDFGVRGRIVKVRPGPVVTLYELEPAPGTKTARVIGLADDIARSMSAVSARIAVVKGRSVIGIELPNARRETVNLRELLASEAYERTGAELPLILGKDIGGSPVIADLARMPHLLIAGTTGSGKSVAINTMVLSLLYRLPPDGCRLIMIDPKMLELSVYDGIPHLLAPVVTEASKAVCALKWAVREMEERYRAMSQIGVRNITSFNARLEQARRKGERLARTVQTGFDEETGTPVYEEQVLDLYPLPYVVLVVDEMADLMLMAGKDIEAVVHRLSQMARAAGIHLIMATQRPSVDVITGTIKANFPTRVSFQVTSRIDSRTILGEPGAEQLLGQGDMLYMAGGGRITRVHGPLVRDAEVERVVNFLRTQGEPAYLERVTEPDDAGGEDDFDSTGLDDELYEQAVALIRRERKASTSFVQRHLQVGYNRAARIIERMEADGIIGPANHVGKREVLVGDADGPLR